MVVVGVFKLPGIVAGLVSMSADCPDCGNRLLILFQIFFCPMFFFEQFQNKLLYFLCHSRKNWDGEPAVSGMVMAWRPVRLKFNKSCARLSGLSRLFPRF